MKLNLNNAALRIAQVVFYTVGAVTFAAVRSLLEDDVALAIPGVSNERVAAMVVRAYLDKDVVPVLIPADEQV